MTLSEHAAAFSERAGEKYQRVLSYLEGINDQSSDVDHSPDITLLTFPNSGTTWIRKLYELTTSVATEAVYPESDCVLTERHTCASLTGVVKKMSTFYFQKDLVNALHLRRSDEATLIKTHRALSKNYTFHRKIVRLIRDPIDNVVSNWNYLNRVGWNKPYPKKPKLTFNRFARDQLRLYMRWHCRALRAAKHVPMLSLRYEDLIEDPVLNMKKLLRFAGWKVDDAMLERLKRAIELYPPRPRGVTRNEPMYVNHLHGSALVTKKLIETMEDEMDHETCFPLRTTLYKSGRTSSLNFLYAVLECDPCHQTLHTENPFELDAIYLIRQDPSNEELLREVSSVTCAEGIGRPFTSPSDPALRRCVDYEMRNIWVA